MRFLFPAAALLVLASCVSAPAPQPAPRPEPPRPAPAPPPPAPAPLAGWADRTLTPGDWSYRDGTATFGGSIFILRCDRNSRQIVMMHQGSTPGGALTIRTTSGNDALRVGTDNSVRVDAYAPVLDKMVFSRGRSAVESDNRSISVIPAWAEVARVVEDCRG